MDSVSAAAMAIPEILANFTLLIDNPPSDYIFTALLSSGSAVSITIKMFRFDTINLKGYPFRFDTIKSKGVPL